ncbi:MAG: type IV pilin protein [Burkholderiales bacterium]
MRHRCHPKPDGFTLLELVVVIAILGVLAAVAVPQFFDMRTSTYKTSVAQTASAFAAAISFAFLNCQVMRFAGQDNMPGFGASNVDFNANCYPSSTNGNNSNVNANRCLQVWNGVLAATPSISTPANDTTDYRAQGSGTTCTYTYRLDTAAVRKFTYSTATGAIVVTNP